MPGIGSTITGTSTEVGVTGASAGTRLIEIGVVCGTMACFAGRALECIRLGATATAPAATNTRPELTMRPRRECNFACTKLMTSSTVG